MRAVAPQIISPETSKNRTANELSRAPGDGAPGNLPALLVEDGRVGQLGQRHVEDPLHLARAGHQVRPRRQGGDHRHDERGETSVVTGCSQPTIVTRAGIEVDLLVGLAQRRRRRVLPLVEPPTREADLPLVGAQAGRAPGQDHPGLAVLLEERGQDAGVDVTHRRQPRTR